MSAPVHIVQNVPWSGVEPRVSVLIPFLRDDPTRLLQALDAPLGDVEIVVLDDGTADPELSARLTQVVHGLSLPCRLVSLATNEGRSKGRNRLAEHARAPALLFLDSDMLPDSPDFLATWRALVATENPALAFGGFSLDQAPRLREHELHRAMALKSDCLSAAERQLSPEKHVFTSNLLIRRDVFESEKFDEAFSGWGWEDVEWAMRVSRRWPIVHIDNTATHLGLDTARSLATKYEQSAANFARIVARHEAIVSSYPSYRVARALKRAPFRQVWRPMLKAFACADALPVGPRALALRLFRAGLYAEVV